MQLHFFMYICCNKKQIIVKITILKNDAFALMTTATGYSENTLEEIIIKRMVDEGLMAGGIEDCGFSVQHIGFENKYDIFDLMNVLFPEGVKNTEIMELLDSIIFWGDGSEHPCPQCGCECDGEEDGADGHVWTDWKCTNGECDFADSGEPDWDVLPGGHAFKNEN